LKKNRDNKRKFHFYRKQWRKETNIKEERLKSRIKKKTKKINKNRTYLKELKKKENNMSNLRDLYDKL